MWLTALPAQDLQCFSLSCFSLERIESWPTGSRIFPWTPRGRKGQRTHFQSKRTGIIALSHNKVNTKLTIEIAPWNCLFLFSDYKRQCTVTSTNSDLHCRHPMLNGENPPFLWTHCPVMGIQMTIVSMLFPFSHGSQYLQVTWTRLWCSTVLFCNAGWHVHYAWEQ